MNMDEQKNQKLTIENWRVVVIPPIVGGSIVFGIIAFSLNIINAWALLLGWVCVVLAYPFLGRITDVICDYGLKVGDAIWLRPDIFDPQLSTKGTLLEDIQGGAYWPIIFVFMLPTVLIWILLGLIRRLMGWIWRFLGWIKTLLFKLFKYINEAAWK